MYQRSINIHTHTHPGVAEGGEGFEWGEREQEKLEESEGRKKYQTADA